MNAKTDAKKIEVAEARAQLSDKLMMYNTKHLKRAQLKHWTYGKDRKPIRDEIIVEEADKRTRVLFGVEYDDQGYIGAVYQTDINGKRTNLNITTTTRSHAQEDIIAKRIEEAKKEVKAPAQKAEVVKAPAKPVKRVVKKAPQNLQPERRA